MIVDKTGVLRFVHYGHSMVDIPENKELLELLNWQIQKSSIVKRMTDKKQIPAVWRKNGVMNEKRNRKSQYRTGHTGTDSFKSRSKKRKTDNRICAGYFNQLTASPAWYQSPVDWWLRRAGKEYFLELFAARMMHRINLSQMWAVDMRVDLSGGNISMTQHLGAYGFHDHCRIALFHHGHALNHSLQLRNIERYHRKTGG